MSAAPPREPKGASGTILIATHGEGRGRPSSFVDALVKRVPVARPRLAANLVVWRTGSPLPALDGVRSVVFLLADPIEAYPNCHDEAQQLAVAARERGLKLLNPPWALNNTVKSRQAQLWQEAGIPCARGWQAADQKTLDKILEAVRYPIIIRPDCFHVQAGMTVCLDKAAAIEAGQRVRYPAAVLEYVDTRESWRDAQPRSIFAQYFHKRRSMVFGSRVVNNHIFFSREPIVGAKTSTFATRMRGQELVEREDELLAADVEFSLAEPEAPELMRAAIATLGLDIAAIDYSMMADGKVILWEANPFFHLGHWSRSLLGRERMLEQRMAGFYDAMMDELQSLIEPSHGA